MHRLPFRKKRFKPRSSRDEASSSHSAASTSECPTQTGTDEALPNTDASCGTLPGSIDPPDDLWDQAYRLLQGDSNGKNSLARYEEILASELGDDERHQTVPIHLKGLAKEKQLAALVSKKLQVMENSRWKLRFRNETIEIRAQAERIVKTVVFAKDFVSSAASSEPHAALAWAGVSLFLPVGTLYLSSTAVFSSENCTLHVLNAVVPSLEQGLKLYHRTLGISSR